jgi:hypothetical protein
MALQWEERWPYYLQLDLPIGRLYISPRKEWNPDKSWNAPNQITVGYTLQLDDGGEGHTFAVKEVPPANMEDLKHQGIEWLREKIQETLTLLDEG